MCITNSRSLKWFAKAALVGLAVQAQPAHALTWTLAGGSENWPANIRTEIINAMNQAVAIYNANGHFNKALTVNYNSSVPTAQGNFSGWIDFGGSRSTRTALHEIAHTLGVGTYGSWNGNSFTRANALVKIYDGVDAGVGSGGGHFWPYGLNYADEDVGLARMRHCRMVAALRRDMGLVGDSDGDGMADDWETFNFGNLSRSGSADADGDGVSNYDEYVTDTNPNQALVLPGLAYTFTARHSGKALDVAGASTADGGNVVQYSLNGFASQKWIAYPVGGGWFKLINVHSGKALDVQNPNTSDGANVGQYSYNGGYWQQWRFADSGVSGYATIYNRHSGKVLDVYAVSTAEDANVVQWTDWRGDGQRWAPTPILPFPNNTVLSFTAVHSGKVAGVEQASTADGGNVAQQSWAATNAQKWKLIDLGGGLVRFDNANSNKSLDVYNFSTVNGGNVNQWAWFNNTNQKWRLESIEGSNPAAYKIVNRNSGLVLDVNGVSTADGANIQQWQYVGGNNQKWILDVR